MVSYGWYRWNDTSAGDDVNLEVRLKQKLQLVTVCAGWPGEGEAGAQRLTLFYL